MSGMGELWSLLTEGQRRGLRRGLALRVGQACCAGAPVALIIPIVAELATGALQVHRAVWYGVVLAGLLIAQYGFAAVANRLLWAGCYHVGAQLRRRVLDRLRRHPMAFHLRPGQAADSTTMLTHDITVVETFWVGRCRPWWAR